MPRVRILNLGSLNLRVSPMLHKDGDMLRCVNVISDPIGAKRKRPGYTTFLGTANGSAVDSLFYWQQWASSNFWLYRVSGGIVYYSTNGTGAWTICGNGTTTAGSPVQSASVENTLMICDGIGTTRHTTNGTSFTDTTAAPKAVDLIDYQDRMYALGTGATLFWSTTGTPTSWTGVDSSSINIPGPGNTIKVTKVADRIITAKSGGQLFRWDGYRLLDMSTTTGPSSGQSVASIENYAFYLNRLGIFGFDGDNPKLISNSIQPQIYNDDGNGIAGTTFDNASGVAHRYDYLLSVGTVTDDVVKGTVSNAILRYNFQLNQLDNWTFANKPTAWLSFKDNTKTQQLIFGDSAGQCYQCGGTATSDNGNTIESIMEGVMTFGAPDVNKQFFYIWAFSNPGCQGHVQVAIENSMSPYSHKWISLRDFSTGVAELRFPSGSEGKFLFWKFTEASRNSRFRFYGFVVDVDFIQRR